METKFKGFDKIGNLAYEQRVFQCGDCENRCDVSEIKTEDATLYYGDRCEKYSGRGKEEKSELPNLFEEREKILMSYKPKHIEGRKTIGIPRGGIFNDNFPLWASFFDRLGFNVITSKKTNKKIIKQGLEATTASFCYPIEAYFGHCVSINEQAVDFVFAPDIIETKRSRVCCDGEIRDSGWDKSSTCPYLQNVGAVIARNTVTKPIINPHFSFRDNRKAIVKELQRAINQNEEKVSRKEINNALTYAEEKYEQFKRRLIDRGTEFIGNLKDKSKGIVIVGRPYSAYDEAINLNLAKKILNNGFIPIPMDFLPYPREDLSKKWKNEFSIQGQNHVGAGNTISDIGLNAVLVDYFSCGPNSFIKGFFAEEIGKPYLTLQIDEHTADAGVVTRLEAFLDTISGNVSKKSREKKFEVREWKLQDLKNRKIWIPHMCDAAFILSSVFRNLGYDSEVLPRSDDPLMNSGRKYTDGDQCIPSIITTEDILKRVFSQDFQQDKEAFFQGKSQGPCRFGRYYMNQQLILHKLGLDNVPIFTLDNRDSYRGLGTKAKILAYDGIISQGLLEKTLHFTRPFEINKGESQKVYEKYLNEISKIVEKGIDKRISILTNNHKLKLIERLEEAYEEFSEIKKTEEKKPLIFVTGEIFVRSSSVANQDLVEKIENLGGVVLLEPVISFFDYTHEDTLRKYKSDLKYDFYRNFFDFIKLKTEDIFTNRDMHNIEKIFDNLFFNFHEPSAKEVVDRGAKYVHPSYSGEAIVTLGSSDYFADKVDGIINTMPFNCMPGMIVNSKTAEFRKNNNNIPFLNLDYDGTIDASRDEKLEIFMYQVKERMGMKEKCVG